MHEKQELNEEWARAYCGGALCLQLGGRPAPEPSIDHIHLWFPSNPIMSLQTFIYYNHEGREGALWRKGSSAERGLITFLKPFLERAFAMVLDWPAFRSRSKILVPLLTFFRAAMDSTVTWTATSAVTPPHLAQ